MSNFTFTVEAPELAAAIAALAAAMSGTKITVPTPAPVIPVQAVAAPVMSPIQPPAAPAPIVAAPIVAAPVQQPAAPVPVAPPVVPVAAAPTYNRDQIMTAGATLIDAGKIGELMGLLNAFGVQAVTQLKQEQLGAFATEMRKLGAQI